MLTAVRQVVR